MIFSDLILAKAGFIFQKYNLHIIEQQDDYLKLQSEYLVIIIVHNKFENSNTLWLGKNDEKLDKVEIDNSTLLHFFHSNLKLSQVSLVTFVDNLGLFFDNEARLLLEGDATLLNKLEKFHLEKSQVYTQDLLEKQHLTAAHKAWESGNYTEFIRLISQINKDKLPLSYQLKYKIATQRG